MNTVYLYNSLSKKKELFKPLKPPNVGLYTCGMTVYDFAHIGHGRKYVGDDVLRRVLLFNGYKVKHVQNVTDVGHLVSDADEGEDKLEKGSRKYGKTVWEVADFFTEQFYDSMDKLNILHPTIICKATEHIREQIDMVAKLIDNSFAYDTSEAVYFDISKYKNYEKLFGQKISDKKVAVRSEIKEGKYKRNAQDFALWFKRVGRFKDHVMHWESPWGDGFPGWHIECSAMSMKYLGEQFDIHTGGEDHLSVHHPNEIAQAEGATGKSPFVKYWIHHAFLKVDGKKMSKSLGNLYTVEDIEKKGYDPLILRYLFLTAHYRDSLNFKWGSLQSAKTAYEKLLDQVAVLKNEGHTRCMENKLGKENLFHREFTDSVNDDLNTPRALSVLWRMVKSNLASWDKYNLLILFDEVLGLNLLKAVSGRVEIPEKVKELVEEREKERNKSNFGGADKLRKEVLKLGFKIEDRASGPHVKPK